VILIAWNRSCHRINLKEIGESREKVVLTG